MIDFVSIYKLFVNVFEMICSWKVNGKNDVIAANLFLKRQRAALNLNAADVNVSILSLLIGFQKNTITFVRLLIKQTKNERLAIVNPAPNKQTQRKDAPHVQTYFVFGGAGTHDCPVH